MAHGVYATEQVDL